MLFVQTIEQFLFKLNRMGQKKAEIAKLVKELPEQFHKRYLEREGYFSDARSSHTVSKPQLPCAARLGG
jgi:endo-1,4-beta-D-glucanase Y